ncbi:MAG: hypothetical protein HY332_08945 [Chloroflexi bacterium]|nr:hypothetical protein [Chloroflexota bacterium]
MPLEKPPERGAVTLLPDDRVEPLEPEVTPADEPDPLDGREAPRLRLRLVTALPAPVPPARPPTAVCSPVMRWAGGGAVSETLPPDTRIAERVVVVSPAPPLGARSTTTVRGGS